MGNYSRRFRTKCWYGFLILAAVSVLSLNWYLYFKKSSLFKQLNEIAAPCIVSGKDIFFLPPSHIFVTNAVVSDGREKLLVVPLARLDISFTELWTGRVAFSGVHLFSPGANAACAREFVKANSAQLLQIFSKFRSAVGVFTARKIRFLDTDRNAGSCDIAFSFRNGSFSGSGSLLAPLSFFPLRGLEIVRATAGHPVEWSLKGSMLFPSVSVEKLELRGREFYAQLWGELAGAELLSHGYLLWDRSKAGHVLPRIEVEKRSLQSRLKLRAGRMLERLKTWLAASPRPPEKLSWEELQAGEELTLAELDCRLLFRLPRVELKRFYVLVDKVPFTASGGLTIGEKPSFELDFASSLLARQAGAPCTVHGWLSGTFTDDSLAGDGEIDVNYHRAREQGAVREARVAFTDAACGLQSSRLVITAGTADVQVRDARQHSLRLEDLTLRLFSGNRRYTYMSLACAVAGGTGLGGFRFDCSRRPPLVRGFMRLEGARPSGFGGVSEYFSQLEGRLDSRMRLAGDPFLLDGKLEMRDGSLKGFKFFTWLEDYFLIPGLSAIDFSRLSADFWLSRQGAGFRGLELESGKTGISGEYGVREGRVNGKLTLSVSRELLAGSKKFTPLLGLVDPKRKRLNLAFQLSGRTEALNFQWLQSDFKAELQDAIPGFVERAIERNVEQMIESLPAEQE